MCYLLWLKNARKKTDSKVGIFVSVLALEESGTQLSDVGNLDVGIGFDCDGHGIDSHGHAVTVGGGQPKFRD